MFNFRIRKGYSTVEMLVTITVILMVLIGFRGYIERSLTGRWKAAGDTFGQTKQYDPRGFGVAGETGGTLDCFMDQPTGNWIMEDCYRARKCDCTFIRADGTALPEYATSCTACKAACVDNVRCR